ncbi:MAG TPA: hypothetical protein PLZ97_09105 [Sediminibacterium sp.]|nr:hypothetical protein [Sediminibacterium sp.]
MLHLMAIAEIVLIVACFKQFHLIDWAQSGNPFMRWFLLFCLAFPPVFPMFDARSRYQNYKQVKDHLFLYGFQNRIIKPFSHSRCQRDAVLAAAEELGYDKECKNYFIAQGYKWHQLMPDFLVNNPKFLFNKQFWLSTFFVKTYISKVDFRKNHQAFQATKKESTLYVTDQLKQAI